MDVPVYEKKVGIKIRRLETYLTESRKLKKDIRVLLPKDQVMECQEMIEEHEAMIMKVEAVLKETKDLCQEWKGHIENMTVEAERTENTTKYKTIMEKLIVAETDCEGIVVELQARRTSFGTRISFLREERDKPKEQEKSTDNEPQNNKSRRETIFGFSAAGADSSLIDNGLDMISAIKLPELELPTFDGNPAQWMHFWQTFETLIDKRSYPTIVKLHYLLSKLQGPSQRLVGVFSEVEENYEDIKEVLKKRFGDPNVLIQSLNEDLRRMPGVTKYAGNARATFENIETICRQLETLGESLNHHQFRMTIMEKLPHWVIADVQKAKIRKEAHGYTWTTTEMRNAMEESLNLRDEIDRATGAAWMQKPYEEERYEVVRKSGEFAAVSRNVTDTRRPDRKLKDCIFCSGSHSSQFCTVHSKPKKREKILKEQGRCLRCMRTDHNEKDCKCTTPCYKCYGNHHSWICPSEVMVENKHWLMHQKQKTTVASAAVGEVESNDEADIEERVDLRWIVGSAAKKVVHKDPSKKERNTLLLTREVELFNTCDDKHEAKDVVFLDNGCQLSMISDTLAKKLQLKPVEYVKMELTTMFSRVSINAPKYEVGIISHYGDAIPLIVYGRESLIGPLETAQVEEEEGKRNKWNVNYCYRQPGLLIGSDYYWMMDVKKAEELKGGTIIISTLLGPMAGGRPFDKIPKTLQSFAGAATVRIVEEEPKDTSTEQPKEKKQKKHRQRSPRQPVCNVNIPLLIIKALLWTILALQVLALTVLNRQGQAQLLISVHYDDTQRDQATLTITTNRQDTLESLLLHIVSYPKVVPNPPLTIRYCSPTHAHLSFTYDERNEQRATKVTDDTRRCANCEGSRKCRCDKSCNATQATTTSAPTDTRTQTSKNTSCHTTADNTSSRSSKPTQAKLSSRKAPTDENQLSSTYRTTLKHTG